MKLVPLFNKKKEITDYVLVDDEDYELVNQYTWYNRSHYAKRNYYVGTINGKKKYKSIDMHIFIFEHHFGPIKKDVVDHKDRNSLNNQKFNLREATNSENGLNKGLKTTNKSGYSGVFRIEKPDGTVKYSVNSSKNNKSITIGYFDNIRHAAIAHDLFLKENYPNEFLNLNISDAKEQEINEVREILRNPKKRKAYSKYVGVTFYYQVKTKPWYARITKNQIVYKLGTFSTELEAALAYNEKAKELLGDKAKLNII